MNDVRSEIAQDLFESPGRQPDTERAKSDGRHRRHTEAEVLRRGGGGTDDENVVPSGSRETVEHPAHARGDAVERRQERFGDDRNSHVLSTPRDGDACAPARWRHAERQVNSTWPHANARLDPPRLPG